MTFGEAVIDRIDAIAVEVRRLRLRAEPGSSLAHAVDRLAGHVDALDAMVGASAAEFVQAGADVEDALERVDARRRRIRTLTGTPDG